MNRSTRGFIFKLFLFNHTVNQPTNLCRCEITIQNMTNIQMMLITILFCGHFLKTMSRMRIFMSLGS